MSLGGYKFAGKYCNKNSLTDTQWALLIHNTRLSAFMSANTLANAGWSFDQTSGDLSFGTYGNVIYSLDSVGYNYVSFVKHGIDNPTYIAIITAFYWNGTADPSSGCINGPWLLRYKSDSQTTQYLCSGNSLYHRLSSVQLNTTNLFIPMQNAAPLIACGNLLHLIETYSGASVSSYNSFALCSSAYFGYAIKDSLVICFSGKLPNKNYIYSSIVSGLFSNLYQPNDSGSMFCAAIYASYFSGQMSSQYGETIAIENSDGASYGVFYAQNPDDLQYNAYALNIPLDSEYTVSALTNEFPFCGVKAIGTDFANTNNAFKGVTQVDLLSANAPSTLIENRSRYNLAANGNLLFYSSPHTNYRTLTPDVCYSYSKFKSPRNFYTALYIGWDPSNPDITTNEAWSEYTE